MRLISAYRRAVDASFSCASGRPLRWLIHRYVHGRERRRSGGSSVLLEGIGKRRAIELIIMREICMHSRSEVVE